MPEEVVDAPVTLPESTTFDEYVASRMEAAQSETLAAVIEPDTVDSPESGQEPETTEPAPVTETTTAVAAEPAAPEPAAEPVTVEETQEQKEQREKKQGIPQARLDEVTKARREAERERDAVKTENERLAKELAEAKAKPATPEPVAAAVEKPVAPDNPALEDFGGDWEAYQVGLKKYHRETYPAYVEQLSDWKAEQRDIANKKKADEAAAATRKQAEDAARQQNEQSEAEVTTSWESQLQAAKDAHPDFEAKIATTPASAAMGRVLMHSENGGEIAYWLTQHPEEAKKIAEATGLGKTLPSAQFEKAVLKAAKELGKIDLAPAEVAAVAAPTATVVTQAPVVPALPVNPKPNTTKAPRPPSPVQERGAPTLKNPADAKSFEEYMAAREAQKTTRR